MAKKRQRVPIFFTVDDNYITYLSIVMASLKDHATEDHLYDIRVIHTGLSQKSKTTLKAFETDNIRIRFFNISFKLSAISVNLDIRDYYSLTTYYRLFLPDLFPIENKCLYLDSDIVILEDVANLYNEDIGNNLLGAVPDLSVQTYPEFIKYVEEIVGVPHEQYFNAGILVMNFKELRRQRIEAHAIRLLTHVSFRVAQDQDILNFLCKGKVKLLPPKWNVMPLGEHTYEHSIIHYNLIFKPWNQNDIPYEDYFWKYAKSLNLAKTIAQARDAIPTEIKDNNRKGVEKVKDLCMYEVGRKNTYYKDITSKKRRRRAGLNMDEIPAQSEEREKILKRIEELEKAGTFDVDAENDPPYNPLQPGEVDYFHKKGSTRRRARKASRLSFKFFNRLIKKGKIVIDKYEGVEILENMQTGAVITANHFNPFDSIPINKAVKKYAKKKKLWTVIREGNYSFPGIYGYFMRNCYSLPLASSPVVLRELMRATNHVLKKGDFVLIYAEQSMWWNYRKPKPLKPGAFRFAARNMVPVIPTFITMRDTDEYDEEGYPIQAYTLHILPPIYPDPLSSAAENEKNMRLANEEAWKEVYEKVYGIPLEYTTSTKAEEAKKPAKSELKEEK